MSNERQPGLFDDTPNFAQTPPPVTTVAAGVARVLMPNRTQLELRPCDLEALLPEVHRARLWSGRGYPAHAQLEQAAESTVVYAPVPKPKDLDTDPHVANAGDSGTVAAWRERMGTDAVKDIDKQRATTAECVNAQTRERGLTRLRLRATSKARCVLLLHALAHNLMRTLALAPDLLGYGKGVSAEPVMAV